ncbi:MAG TPA: LemA family protein [Armatimonadota bacterium]|jgi:LemA protein
MNSNSYDGGGGKGRKTALLGCGCVVLVLLFLCLSLYGAFKSSYNRLNAQNQQVKAAWAEVENNLQRRSDLIPNLVATVKGVAGQEQKVFGDIANARARIGGAGAGPSDAKIKASNDMSSAISRLLVIVENYPNLKSNENFLNLQDEVTGTENRLAHSREQYNTAVQGYNETAKSFPMVLFVTKMGFKAEQPFFEAPAEAKARPNIDFGK